MMLKEIEIVVERLPVGDYSTKCGFISRPKTQLEELPNLDTITTEHAEQPQSTAVQEVEMKKFQIIVKRLPVGDYSAECGFISKPRIQLEELPNLDTIMTGHTEQLQSTVVQEVDMKDNTSKSDDCEIIDPDETMILLDEETFVTSTENSSTELKLVEHEIYDKKFFDIFINHHLEPIGSAKAKVGGSSKIETIVTGHTEQLHSVFISKALSEIKDNISEDCEVIDIDTSKADMEGKQSVRNDSFAGSKPPAGIHFEKSITNNGIESEGTNGPKSRIECIYFSELTEECIEKQIFLHECVLECDEPVVPVTIKLARTLRVSTTEAEVNINAKYACQRCKKIDQPEWILLCDICDHGYHCSCLKPELLIIPEINWICPNCQKQKLIKNLSKLLRRYDLASSEIVVVDDLESSSSDVEEAFTQT